MRIETLELWTGNLEGQRAFYGERLGFPTTDDGEGVLSVKAGASMLTFRQGPGFRGVYHFAFGVHLAQIAASERFLRKVGVIPIADASENALFASSSWNAESVYFRDPAGNIVEFIGRREIEADPVGPSVFSNADVLNVSETGVVCAEVMETAGILTRTLDLKAYRDTIPTFFPLGDAHGLLILVPPGRIWFPDTGVPAEDLPFRVTVATTNGRWSITTAPLSIARL